MSSSRRSRAPGHPRIVAGDLGDDVAAAPESLPLSCVLPDGVGHRCVSFRVNGAVCPHHERTPVTGHEGGVVQARRPKGQGRSCRGCASSGAKRAGAWLTNRTQPAVRDRAGCCTPVNHTACAHRRRGRRCGSRIVSIVRRSRSSVSAIRGSRSSMRDTSSAVVVYRARPSSRRCVRRWSSARP